MEQKVRVGIAGLGNHAIQPHLAKLLKMRNVEVVGAYDPDISKLDQANKILGTNLKYFNSYQELCFASDAVVICSPDKVHFSQLMIAVKEYGCHVLVEKPILTSKSQLEEFKELVMTTNKVVTTCHPRRFDAMYVYVRDLVKKYEKVYGKVHSFELSFERQIPSENERRNYNDSLLSDHLCHEIDYLNFVLGCKKAKVHSYSDAYDAYNVYGKRRDGVEFIFRGSRRLPKGSSSIERIEVVFQQATLIVTNGKENYIFEHLSGKKIELDSVSTDHNAKYSLLNRNFIDSVLGRAKPYLNKKEIIMAAELPLGFMPK